MLENVDIKIVSSGIEDKKSTKNPDDKYLRAILHGVVISMSLSTVTKATRNDTIISEGEGVVG